MYSLKCELSYDVGSWSETMSRKYGKSLAFSHPKRHLKVVLGSSENRI